MAVIPFHRRTTSIPSWIKSSSASGQPSLPPDFQPALESLLDRFLNLAASNEAAARKVLQIGDWVLRHYGACLLLTFVS